MVFLPALDNAYGNAFLHRVHRVHGTPYVAVKDDAPDHPSYVSPTYRLGECQWDVANKYNKAFFPMHSTSVLLLLSPP